MTGLLKSHRLHWFICLSVTLSTTRGMPHGLSGLTDAVARRREECKAVARRLAGNTAGYLSSGFYLGSRVSQIVKNWQRASAEASALLPWPAHAWAESSLGCSARRTVLWACRLKWLLPIASLRRRWPAEGVLCPMWAMVSKALFPVARSQLSTCIAVEEGLVALPLAHQQQAASACRVQASPKPKP